ncbi:Mitogen-activated protein kinase kinase kinase 1 [Morella rubra]|uniref:Mitogen-activated protein kinase kinase kinase 1 n=1 Tax=Morella rubra TaxID=262757 RepID=A0A6A1UZ87_9ROSI|nr:Mitogen-activated protein kinase kinase kinase 1 [Morella rubra]
MDRRKKPRKPTLERRNAAKHIEYDAVSSSSSLDESTSSSLHTRSLDLSDRMSFRVEGIDGEMDLICSRLGLSGPDDFSIPTAAWEALKIRSSSDILPLSGIHGLDSPKTEEVKDREEAEAVSELRQRAVDVARTRDETEVSRAVPAESSGCCNSSGGGNGIKGIRPPPVLKPPPAMRLPIFDNACSSWDLVKDFGPDAERGSSVIAHGGYRSSSDDEVEEEEKDEDKEEGGGEGGVEVAREKREVVEENGLRFGQIASPSESCSFTTSNDDDSSSTTTEPMSNISPTGRIRPNITSFEKGALLGRGSFGAVYEAIAE